MSARAIAIALVLAGAQAALADGRGTGQNLTGRKELHMANCPSAVEGATTVATDTDEGVELRVTAREPAAQDEIRRRSQKQAEVAMLAERGTMEHSGLGTGSGIYGFCPGMVRYTTVAAFDLPDGARLVVKTYRREDAPALQKLTHERIDALERAREPRPVPRARKPRPHPST